MPTNARRPSSGKLTPNMVQALRDIAAGRAPGPSAGGRSAAGGFTSTMYGLRQRGLVAGSDAPPYIALTDAGRLALSQVKD